MDFGRAFNYVFNDPEWVKKILLGGLISLIPLIGGFVVYGYTLEIVRRVYTAESNPLPEWDDFGGYLSQGFLLWIAMIVWFLPVSILIGCIAGALAAAGGATGDDAAVAISTIAAIGLFSVLFLVILVWAVLFLPIITGRFAVERSFGSMFQFSEILAEVRQTGVGTLLLLMVLYLVAGFVGQLGFVLCLVGVIFTSFYSNIVIAHGAGQIYRRARGLPPLPPAGQATTF